MTLRDALRKARVAIEDAEAIAAAGRSGPAARSESPAGDGLAPFSIARRFVGMKELAGAAHNPQIVAMLKLDHEPADSDEIPWCSGFANYCAWLAGYQRSKSLRARSWLRVGAPVDNPADIRAGDVVVLMRGGGRQPGPDVIAAPGHVGFVAEAPGASAARIRVLGGNQGDRVSVKSFPTSRVLGVRRLRRL